MNAIARPAEFLAPKRRSDIPGTPAVKGILQAHAGHFFDGVLRPDAYGMRLTGTCMQPDLEDGDMALMSIAELPVVGDYVGLFLSRPGAIPLLKRLVMAPNFRVGGMTGDLTPLVVVEMFNPPRQMLFRGDDLVAMHRCVGLVRRAELVAVRRPAKPAGRRKAGAA